MKKKNFIPIAKEVIETEIRSLKKLKISINNSFNKAVRALINCKNGKVVIYSKLEFKLLLFLLPLLQRLLPCFGSRWGL